LTDTHPMYVNRQTHAECMLTDKHTSSVCELTDTYPLYVHKFRFLLMSAQTATEPSSLCHYKTHRLSLLRTCSRCLLHIFITWPSICSTWVMYLEF